MPLNAHCLDRVVDSSGERLDARPLWPLLLPLLLVVLLDEFLRIVLESFTATRATNVVILPFVTHCYGTLAAADDALGPGFAGRESHAFFRGPHLVNLRKRCSARRLLFESVQETIIVQQRENEAL